MGGERAGCEPDLPCRLLTAVLIKKKKQKQRGCTSVCEMLLCSTVALLLVGIRAHLVPTFPSTLPAEEPGIWASPFGEVSYSRVMRPWQGRGAASGGLSGLILLGLCI